MNITKAFAVALCAASTLSGAAFAAPVDLNALSLDQIIAEAKKEGRVDSVGMPDTWVNWGGMWAAMKEKYGLEHTDNDMSSAEELAVFEAEKDNATKDIGDVGQSFGPLAEKKGLTLPYKTSYWDSIPAWAKDENGDWIVAYTGTIAFITNDKLVKNPPKSFADLLAGDYMVNAGDVVKATVAQNAVLAAAYAHGGDEKNIQPGLDFFRKLAEQGRLDRGEYSIARLQKGEIPVAIQWDFNCLNYRDMFMKENPNASYTVTIPIDGSVQSGYTTVINRYSKRPHAAALTREFILSDEGQIMLARGYGRPIRSDVKIPEDLAQKLIPAEQYAKARPISDQKAWEKTVRTLGILWQEEVMAYAE